ncbi:hypothetical protein HYW75_03200 [Candidatus Pacearchaeota archaeon]|nr:hypothetical protein [Candidatus Pacearchaeota archaeon]
MQTMKNKFKNGQVWIETVIYTVIGLALIGTVLAFVSPKISETRDKIAIEQSIEAMQTLDAKVQEVIGEGTGSKRIIGAFNLKRGELIIDPSKDGNTPVNFDTITLKISNLKYLYSESGEKINFGRVELISTKGAKTNEVELVLRYNSIKYGNQDSIKLITAASTPYKLSIENKKDAGGTGNYVDFLIER